MLNGGGFCLQFFITNATRIIKAIRLTNASLFLYNSNALLQGSAASSAPAGGAF